ncbi:MAG: VWA domain-containing protein, partial [Acidobacteriota bacterium]
LHPVSRSAVIILSRNGQDFVQTSEGAPAGATPQTPGLSTFGEFGAIFSILFGDLHRGTMDWSYWEPGPAAPAAVFRFAVPRDASHYQVRFCCSQGRVFQQFAAYHGEIAIDPADGTILRLTLMADMGKSDPIVKADLMVEYGPFRLGGKTYFCPARSIALSLARASTSGALDLESPETPAPLRSMLNEVVFSHYHLFHAEARILAGENGELTPAPSAAAPAATPSIPASSVAAPQQAAVPNLNPAPSAPVPAPLAGAGDSSGEPAGAAAAASAAIAAAAPPAPPEMGVVTPAPDRPNLPAAVSFGSQFSLRLSSRLVDIGVTAHDRKGRPVRGLTREDFVVCDNGVRQTLRSFSHPGSLSSDTAPAAQSTLYFNRLDAGGAPQPAAQSSPESSTVVLFDATSLPFADFTRTREQLLRFFARLPAAEQAGLYVRAGQGFNVLAEAGAEHAALTSALRQWKPDAAVLARAQEQSSRSLGPLNLADNPAGVPNGYTVGLSSPNPVLDFPGGNPEPAAGLPLQPPGGDSTRKALTALAAVAVHLGAVPGHKNLVWIAGESVLSGWTVHEPGGADLDSLAARIQEALNDAHVSLYPLNASPPAMAPIDNLLPNESGSMGASARNVNPASQLNDAVPRTPAAMRSDLRPIQVAIRQIAQATGGQAFERSNNLNAALKSAIDDGNAAYLLSFAPQTPPDNTYHRLTVEVPARRGIRLRYRTGYLFSKEPSTLQDRFRKAVWQPLDETGIALTARPLAASQGAAVTLEIAAGDLDLAQQDGRRTGRLDIFLVQRDDVRMDAQVKEQTLALNLKPETYRQALRDGIHFDQYIGESQNTGAIRIIVVDENSGRLGSVTLPSGFATGKPDP